MPATLTKKKGVHMKKERRNPMAPEAMVFVFLKKGFIALAAVCFAFSAGIATSGCGTAAREAILTEQESSESGAENDSYLGGAGSFFGSFGKTDQAGDGSENRSGSENQNGDGAQGSSGAQSIPGSEGGTSSSAAQIYVYVVGAVASPGVYGLPENSRVCDAITKAGGLSAEADMTRINQARILTDGEQITVLTKDEAQAAGSPAGTQISAEGETLVNINTADETGLQTLSGIGEAKAAAIVEYRETNGAFRTIEEITKVSGIGQGLFDRIKDKITVG